LAKILGIGDIDVDLLIKVDTLPKRDEKVRGELLGEFPGGIMGNFCCAASNFGINTDIIASVGNDRFGKLSINSLREFGVNTNHIIINNERTYFCIVHLDDTGEKALTVVETPNLTPNINDIDLEVINNSQFVHLTSLDFGLVKYIVENANKNIIFSIDIEPTADKKNLKEWKELLKKINILIFNQQGIRDFTKINDNKQAVEKILGLGAENVIITKGKNGVEVFTENEFAYFKGYEVEVKDTTGAGDCFNGIFISGLAKGWDFFKAAYYANAAAAISVQQIGARSSLPDQRSIEKFLEEKEGLNYDIERQKFISRKI